MKKQAKIIIAALFVLLAALVVLLIFSLPEIRSGRQSQEDKTLKIIRGGEAVAVLSAEDIYGLESETFEATVRSSGKRPVTAVYTGVEIQTLLSAAGLDLAGVSSLVFRGADMYATTVEISELSETGSIYVVYERDGDLMESRENGGEGPYQIVIPGDYYSLRWCKYLSEVELK